MTGSSIIPPAERLSQAEFRSRLSDLGCEASDRQLERWRNEGLLPHAFQMPAYRPDGRPAGSTVEHLGSAVGQVIAIDRTLGQVRSIDRAGAILWMAGYEVDERYWRPALMQSDRAGRLVGRWARRLLGDNDFADTFGERVASAKKLGGVLHKIARKAGDQGLARGVDIAVDVAAGEFSGFAPKASCRDVTDHELAERALGFGAGATHHINGQRLELGTDLATILEAMSAPLSLQDFTDKEIATARDDARNALKVVFCLHSAAGWIYGDKAFGIHIAAELTRIWPLTLVQALALSFARLRRRPNTLLPSDKIANLATESERTWLISMWFRDTYEDGGEAAKIINPKRLKSAFTDSASYRNLLKELAGYEFVNREFRPWDQWRKSTGKTMSPGLLAMSIGAPNKLDLADIAPNASKPRSL